MHQDVHLHVPEHLLDEAQRLVPVLARNAELALMGRMSRALVLRLALQKAHSTEFSGGVCHRSSKASRGKDVPSEEPSGCGSSTAFHRHATQPGMRGTALRRHQMGHVREPCDTRLWAPVGRMAALHHEALPVDGVMRLIQPGARHRHPGGCEDRRAARVLVLKPLSHTGAVGRPGGVGDRLGQAASPLAPGHHPHALAMTHPVPSRGARRASRRADRRRDGGELPRACGDRGAQAVAETHVRPPVPPAVGRAVEALRQEASDPRGGLLTARRPWPCSRGWGQGRGTGRLGGAYMPEPAATDTRGAVHVVCQTVAGRFISPAIRRQRQSAPDESRPQPVRAAGPAPAREGHRRELTEDRAAGQPATPRRGSQGGVGDVRTPRAIAPEARWEDRAHRGARRTRHPPARDATATDPDSLRVAGPPPAAATGRLVWPRQAAGEAASAHPVDTGRAVAKARHGGRFRRNIARAGSVFTGLAGVVSHGSPAGQMVVAADDPRWGSC